MSQDYDSISFRYAVFLSHSSSDKWFVRLLRGYLRAHNLDAAFDEDFAGPSLSLRPEINQKIVESKYFAVILSENTNGSEWVNYEISYAKNNKKKIIAIVIPGNVSIPPEIVGLIRIDISDYGKNSDPFRDFRDAIKDATPNYVANPQYGQLHLIETRDLSRYLERYRTTSVKMWYINGSYSFGTISRKLFEQNLTNNQSQLDVKCLLQRTDIFESNISGIPTEFSNDTKKSFRKLMSNDASRSIIQRIVRDQYESVIELSEIKNEMGSHYKQLESAKNIFEKTKNNFPDTFSYEIRETPRLMSARLLILDDVAFFAPPLSPAHEGAPVLVVDRSSSLYERIDGHFTNAFDNANEFSI